MGFNLADFHRRNRSRIIHEWVKRLRTEGGKQYVLRPLEELRDTVSEAFRANHHVLVYEDYSLINKFINKITRMRLEAGFLLSDVQKAFELYRSIVIPLLAKRTDVEDFYENVEKINRCLAYTIHRFSDHFQTMHEKEILAHNRMLEGEVKARTADLKESELKYKTLVEEINDGYFVIQDGVIVFANQAFCEMHGYPLDEVLGRRFYRFVDPTSRERVLDIYKDSISERSAPGTFEYLRLTRDGEAFPTEITAKLTRYEKRFSNIGICRDISKRVQMEQRVREAEKMAYIGQITTSLSHEIRNPLSAVKMNLQILEKNAQLHGNDKRRIDISVKEVIRLERILRELLDFAKPLHLDFRSCRVNQVLSSCAELLEMKFKEENLSGSLELDPQLPDILADEEKLGQAVINLLLNAMEACDGGDRVLVKSVYHPDTDSSMAEIVVEDEGIGVPEDRISDIFKPFFTTKSKGTGLGLSNVKRIVEAHNGWVEAENRRPCGASFRVFLPVGKDHG